MNLLLLQRWHRRLGDRRLHEFLWYCVPGVIVAIAIRAWLTASMPYGVFHFDTPDFLQTPFDLLQRHRLTLHNKKTFLVPLLYTVPFLLHVPALIIIPAGQHLLGTLLVLMTGALARLWFAWWRALIVPLTVLVAMHPSLLWFEHTLLAETAYVVCVVWAALAGTLFVRRPGWESLGFLLAALFFTAGARPEGRLFLAFGVGLVGLVYLRTWRVEVAKLAVVGAFCVGTLLATRTAQAGILLYTSILHLAPDESRVAPDLMSCLRPMRDRLRHERTKRIFNDVVRVEKRLSEQIVACFAPRHPEMNLGEPGKYNAKNLNKLCLRLALETARQNPLALSGIVGTRFLARIEDDSGGEFANHDLQTRQYRALKRGMKRAEVLGVGLAGVPLDNEDAVTGYVYAHFDERRVGWYNRWEHFWMETLGWWHLPDRDFSDEYKLPGLPMFYVFALLGAAAALVKPGRFWVIHLAFLPILAGVWFTVTLTGAIMPRYRFVLEPFWWLYFFGFVDVVLRLLVRRRSRPVPPLPA